MIHRFLSPLIAIIGCLFASPVSFSLASGQERFSGLEEARVFLRMHCISCHGPDKQENELRLDSVSTDLADQDTLETWQAVVDQLNLGNMPPKDHKQPDEKSVAQTVELVTGQLKQAYANLKTNGRSTIIRRLNRYELRNTLRDLLYLTGDADFDPLLVTKLEDRNGNGRALWNSNDPTREFPADDEIDGFDNIGGQLVMSDFLLEKLMSAAEYSLDQATHNEKKTTELDSRRFTSPIRTQGPGPGLQSLSREYNQKYDGIYQRYREPGASTNGLGRVSSDALARTGVGFTTRYRVIIEASAHNQKHPWGELIKSRQEEPLLLGLHLADSRRGGLGENPTSRQVKQWTLPSDGNKHVLTFDCWIDGTWFPWVGWENGPFDRGLRPAKIVERYYPELFHPAPDRNSPQKDKQAYESSMGQVLFKAGYQGPHVRVYSLTITPIEKSWPPKSHVALYGQDDRADNTGLLLKFAERAFRRPVQQREISTYLKLVEQQLAAGKSRTAALRTGYTAMLASPRFYYLRESEGRLDAFALASRLSYFLWSSMPDEKLFSLANSGDLLDGKVLLAQVERMLEDPKSLAFKRRFPERWLRIDKLGSMPPPGGFYYHREMETEMREQIDAYFSDAVQTNAPISSFIESDHTFLNERVAQWIYKRNDVWGDRFRKVPAREPYGGGILTMPALMTATANGVDTSPVVRGVWILESLLGRPPSPPPPDVEPLSPDLRNAKTIREQLVAHRAQPTCNKCHQKIDPLGFPFENFDELGIWRTHYRRSGGNQLIDATATMPGGKRINNVAELKQALLERQSDIVRNLTEKLLSYASGRVLEPIDRGTVDEIVTVMEKKQGGIRDLIKLVVMSDIFLTK